MSKRTRYHIGMSLGFLMRLSDEQLDRVLVLPTGHALSASAARRYLVDAKERGVEVLVPDVCDNQDPTTGRCLGHTRMPRRVG